MSISVVICAYTLDRWRDLERAVRSCFEQTVVPDEVIVVVDYNDELLNRVSQELRDVKVVPNQMTKGLSGARNTGILNSSGEIIAFLDDDAFADSKWLEELVAPMVDPMVAGTGGWVVPEWDDRGAAAWFPETFYWILGCSYSGLPDDGASIRNPIGANMAIRRNVFAFVGGFTSGIGRIGVTPLGCEETELCIRYADEFPEQRFQLASAAVVHHRVPASRLTWRYFWTRCWAEGLSKAAVASLVGSASGLSAERKHVLVSLPREIFANLQSVVAQPRNAISRVALIVVGTAIAAAGYARGSVALRRSPLRLADGEQEVVLHALAGSRADAVGGGDRRRGEKTSAAISAQGVLGSGHSGSGEWQPLLQVSVDLDNDTPSIEFESMPGQRVWVEATRGGQVVGVREARVEASGLSDGFLTTLRAEFESSVPSFTNFLADEDLPKFSVVVPSICRDLVRLGQTVNSLLALDYPEFEVIVVDNRTTTDHEPLPPFPGGGKVKVVSETTPGGSAARNRGVAEATSELIAFTDDDATVEPDWLKAMATRFIESPKVDAIGGLVLPSELRTPPQLWFEEFYGGFTRSFQVEIMSLELFRGIDPMFPYAPGKFGAGCNMAVRRAALESVNGFDCYLGVGTPAWGGEDLNVFMSLVLAGRTVAFEPAALVRHTHRATEDQFMKQVFGYGTGLAALFTQMIVKDPRHIVEIVRRLPKAFQLMTKRRELRSPSSAPSYPARTYLRQLLGMAYGPIAYARSVAKMKRLV